MVCLSKNVLYVSREILLFPHHECGNPIEKMYYSCVYEAIYIHGGEYLANVEDDLVIYPQWVDWSQLEAQKRV